MCFDIADEVFVGRKLDRQTYVKLAEVAGTGRLRHNRRYLVGAP